MDQDELLFRLNQLELGLKKQDERSHQQFVLILNRQDAFAQKLDQFRDNVKQKLGALNAKNDSVEKLVSEKLHTFLMWTIGLMGTVGLGVLGIAVKLLLN